MLQGGQQRLHTFLVSAFGDELPRWIAIHFPGLAPHLATKTSESAFAWDFVRAAQGHGLIDGRFFNLLEQARPNRVAEVAALRSEWRDRWLDGPSHTAIVLDRVLQWRQILTTCAEDMRHLVIVIHGDREQDLDLFVLRIKRFLDHPLGCSRRHIVTAVSRTRGAISALAPEDWTRHVCESLGYRMNDLASALERVTRASAALFILEDGTRPLQGLRGPDFAGLSDFLCNTLPEAIAAKQPHNPIRFIVSVEHRDDRRAVLRALDDLTKRFKPLTNLALIRARELCFPTLTEIREHLTAEVPGLTPERWARCKALHDRVRKAHERTLRDLADPLEEMISAWEMERASPRPGPMHDDLRAPYSRE